MNTTAATSTVALIQGTFDIAQARNTLRIKIAHRGWTPLFNAHASTALTALGELILSLKQAQPIPVKIASVEQPGRCGIELSTRFRLTVEKPPQWDERCRNLEKASAETTFNESGDVIEITTCIRVK